MEFSWSEEKEDILVDEWRKYPCLYDGSLKSDKVKKATSCAAIAEKLETTPVEVNKRMNSLRTMYSRQLKNTGSGGRRKTRTLRQEWINIELAFLKPYVRTKTSTPPNDLHTLSMDADDSSEEVNNATDDHAILGINTRTAEAVPEQYVNEHAQTLQERKRSNWNKKARVENFGSVQALPSSNTSDYFSIFGQHVANELRQIKDKRVLEVLKKKINDAIFEAKIGLGDFSEEGIELPHRQSSSYWTA